jgi:hypothetical protein
MKHVTIYSDCRFNYTTRDGWYFAALEYNGNIKLISGGIAGRKETGNRGILYGLIDAVKLLKEPCKLTISTSTPVGFKKRHESVNGDLIAILLNTMDEKGCIFTEKLLSREEVRRITQSHRVNRKKIAQVFP